VEGLLKIYNESHILRENEEAKKAFNSLMKALNPESHWSKRAVVSF
jgi:hypothetical protein